MSITEHIPRMQVRDTDDHEAIRQNIAKQIDEFFARGGEVEEIPFGASSERLELETRQKGKSGARSRYKGELPYDRKQSRVLFNRRVAKDGRN